MKKVVDFVKSSYELPCTGFGITDLDGNRKFLEYKLARHKRILSRADEKGRTKYRRCDVTVSDVNFGNPHDGRTFVFDEYLALGRPEKIKVRHLIEYTPTE